MNEIIKNKEAFIIDMDGVLYHGNNVLEGALEFVDWLKANNKKYLFLTNSSERSPKELSQKLARLGIEVAEEHFYTSAIAT
ncbi:MAG: TIGR01457 family HAD-type hydrolase, partial [Clostridia bacterium]|nr:TIGR01457 family HAD-type hydrolase [Clostridia bacterium]